MPPRCGTVVVWVWCIVADGAGIRVLWFLELIGMLRCWGRALFIVLLVTLSCVGLG